MRHFPCRSHVSPCLHAVLYSERTVACRARQDSWIQAYSEVFEEEASPFQDLFEGPGADSLFASNEVTCSAVTLAVHVR